MEYAIPNSTDGRRTNGGAEYALTEFKPYQIEIIQLLACGVKPPEVAEKVGVGVQTVRNIQNYEPAREMISILQDARMENAADIARDIGRLAPKCIKLLNEIVDFKKLKSEGTLSMLADIDEVDTNMQKTAATDILKIVIPRKKIEKRTHYISGRAVDRIKERNMQAEAEEASFEEVTSGEVNDLNKNK